MAQKQAARQQHGPPDPCPQGEQQHIAMALGRPLPGLTHEGAIGVVGQGHGALQLGFEPFGQGHLAPALQVDRDPCHPPLVVGWARQADTDPVGATFRIELGHGCDDRHAGGSRYRGLGCRHLQGRQQLALLIKPAQLDGGAAQVHADHFPGGGGWGGVMTVRRRRVRQGGAGCHGPVGLVQPTVRGRPPPLGLEAQKQPQLGAPGALAVHRSLNIDELGGLVIQGHLRRYVRTVGGRQQRKIDPVAEVVADFGP